MRAIRFCFALLLISLCAPSQDIREFERRVAEFTLANGLDALGLPIHQIDLTIPPPEAKKK